MVIQTDVVENVYSNKSHCGLWVFVPKILTVLNRRWSTNKYHLVLGLGLAFEKIIWKISIKNDIIS